MTRETVNRWKNAKKPVGISATKFPGLAEKLGYTPEGLFEKVGVRTGSQTAALRRNAASKSQKAKDKGDEKESSQ